MDFGFKKEEIDLIKEVRAFIREEVTPELVDETRKLGAIFGGAEARKFIKKLAAKGWLTPAWPKEYGGLDASEMITYMIRDEMAYAELPLYYVAAYNAGPMILRDGSEEMKKEFLPPIARGEVEFALGYTEPQAGSDLAALNIRAEDRGDHFLLNGQKTFNTHTHVDIHYGRGPEKSWDHDPAPHHHGRLAEQ